MENLVSLRRLGFGNLRKLTLGLGAAFALSLSAHATTLTSSISMDNGFIAYLSTADNVTGTSFSSGNDWTTTFTTTVSLTAGTDYYLHVYGYDQGGIAGFLGQFHLSDSNFLFSNSTTNLLTNTTDWSGNAAGFTGSYSALSNLGTNGVGPWGTRPGISTSATWIWSGNATNNDASYFTTKITAQTSAVPDVGSTVSLLMLSLAAVTFGRRKLAR